MKKLQPFYDFIEGRFGYELDSFSIMLANSLLILSLLSLVVITWGLILLFRRRPLYWWISESSAHMQYLFSQGSVRQQCGKGGFGAVVSDRDQFVLDRVMIDQGFLNLDFSNVRMLIFRDSFFASDLVLKGQVNILKLGSSLRFPPGCGISIAELQVDQIDADDLENPVTVYCGENIDMYLELGKTIYPNINPIISDAAASKAQQQLEAFQSMDEKTEIVIREE